MKIIIVESPFASDIPELKKLHEEYLEACLKDCIDRGESPYASHAIGPRCLDDNDPEERNKGMDLVDPFRRVAHATAVYEDLGISGGMYWGIEHAYDEHDRRKRLPTLMSHRIVKRKLRGDWAKRKEAILYAHKAECICHETVVGKDRCPIHGETKIVLRRR